MILFWLKIDYAALKDIAAMVQSLAVAIAALLGGTWALYTYKTKRDKDKSEAELLALQRKLHLQASIDPSMNITAVYFNDEIHLSITVTLKNNGNRDIRLDFSERTLAVAKLNIAKQQVEIKSLQHSPVYGFSSPEQEELWDIPYWIMEAGGTETFPFWIKLQEDGLYLISFKSGLTGHEATIIPTVAGGKKEHLFSVQVRQFVMVKPNNKGEQLSTKKA